ncbi:MAG TPA: MmgE/PrpD family protein [candidate division Zixibacteria bacterium]|nr:MmgE/PrpD family protein [candidate division Zixibacteria bacterium]
MTINEMIHDLTWTSLPETVKKKVRRCLLDTIATALCGRKTEVSKIIYEFAARTYGGSGARLWLDGRSVSPPGAALAHGMTIDSFDMHDSCRPVKGHAGVALVPTVLATLSLDKAGKISGQELLTSLVAGYEVAIRAGKALHATASDYHTSGAWSALGCAAVTARRLGLIAEETRHALGIAEYHGPRSQMMRCIDHPTMVKDGSGWGAMCGVSAALMASAGFTGAPALTVEDQEVAETWDDMGTEWMILIQYFKPYAVCYWTQAAIAGALNLQKEHHIKPEDIKHVQIFTFHEAYRLACRRPQATDEAQYSLPFPVAMALVRGRLGLDELTGEALHDPTVLRLIDRIEVLDDDTFNARFPAERLSRVVIDTVDGESYDSGKVQPLWDLSAPPTDNELREKFRWLATYSLSEKQAETLEEAVWHCDELDDTSVLEELLSYIRS